jgi:cytochrome c
MKRSNWKRVWLLMAMISVLLVGVAMAGEKATKEESEAKCKAAAALIQELGMEGAKPQLEDPNGAFVWKDTYVFIIDMEKSTNLVHPVTPALVGKPLAGIKDVNGKMFFVEFINTAKTNGEGWVEYMWPKVGEKTPSLKKTYVYRVPGHNIAAAAGIYE